MCDLLSHSRLLHTLHVHIYTSGGVCLSWKMIKMESPAAAMKKLEIPTDSGLSIVIDLTFNRDVCIIYIFLNVLLYICT